jgi:hypothetical protein
LALRPATTHPPDDEPLSVLVARLGEDVRRIVRAEVALVQVRVDAGVEAARAAAGGLVAAVVLALAAVGALVAGAVLLLATLVPLATWIAALIVGGVLLVLGALAGVAAVGILKRGLRVALEPEVEVIGRER